ncbi:hypothetical protein C1925_03465 [Stenotrophomonas sp. SAU14A_NAIMI4_5]|nr:hypothetical protein C1925_03465 [Stenotrophomonas sp. SAU14A_NAIMI4_5]
MIQLGPKRPGPYEAASHLTLTHLMGTLVWLATVVVALTAIVIISAYLLPGTEIWARVFCWTMTAA